MAGSGSAWAWAAYGRCYARSTIRKRTLRGVLIGGTNGKGSVQALVAAALREAGYRVGQTPKPHLSEYRERIVVDGQPIAPDDFAQVVGEVLEQAARIEKRVVRQQNSRRSPAPPLCGSPGRASKSASSR